MLANATWPIAQLLDESMSVNISLETRLKSESFKPLIKFLAFLLQTLWPKNNKLII